MSAPEFIEGPDFIHEQCELRGPFVENVFIGAAELVSLHCAGLSLNSHHAEGHEPYAVLALGLKVKGTTEWMALHQTYNAQDLRQLAAACLSTADTLDGGRGKQ